MPASAAILELHEKPAITLLDQPRLFRHGTVRRLPCETTFTAQDHRSPGGGVVSTVVLFSSMVSAPIAFGSFSTARCVFA
jgi:hypothetical protein